MDEVRRIRLLIAPALFVASILWGAWWDPDSTFSKHVFRDHDWSKVIGLIAGGGFVVFVGDTSSAQSHTRSCACSFVRCTDADIVFTRLHYPRELFRRSGTSSARRERRIENGNCSLA